MAPQSSVTPGSSAEETLRPLLLIFVAMLTAQLMLVGLMAFLVSQGQGGMLAGGDVLLAVGALLVASTLGGAIFVTTLISRKRLETTDPSVRMTQLRSLFIVRMAILEGATLANAVFYFLQTNIIFLAFVAVSLTAFVVLRPKLD